MDGRNGDVCVEERAGAGAPAAPAVAICGLKVGVARVYPASLGFTKTGHNLVEL